MNEGGKRNQDLPRGGVHVHDLPHSSRGPLKIGGIERSGDTQESHTTKGSNWKAKNTTNQDNQHVFKDQAKQTGATPMDIASARGHLEIVRMLSEVGTNKDQA